MTIQNGCSNTTGHVPPSSMDGQIQINQFDDIIFTHKPSGMLRSFLLPKRFGVADASFQIRPFDTYVGIASLTAPRTLQLPAAASYAVGHPLTIADESGLCSPTLPVTIAAATPAAGVTADTLNGLASITLSVPNFGPVFFSDGVSKWTAVALPASGAANALLFVPQAITTGQQDQARSNMGGGQPATPSTTTALGPLDFERDQSVTGAVTLTMPSAVAPGWRSGEISNDNALAGIVTLAVPSGHSLNGVVNGSTPLLPKQRARLKLIASGVWRTSWVERSTLLGSIASTSGSPLASFALTMPSGYSGFRLMLSKVRPGVAGAHLFLRLSDDGGATFKSGASDYSSSFPKLDSSGGSNSTNTFSFAYITNALATSGNIEAQGEVLIGPGGSGLYPTVHGRMFGQDNATGLYSEYLYLSSVTSIGANPATAVQGTWSSGTGTFVATLFGIP